MSDIVSYIAQRLRRGLFAFISMVTLANRDYPYHDYHSDTTTSTKQPYRVGQNNRVGDGDQHKLFVSKSTLIMATTNTYVVFNSSNNVVQTLVANTWYTFESNIYVIYYYYVAAEGTIYIHAEGVAPQEARRPE